MSAGPENLAADAQARRDRERLAALQAETVLLRRRVTELEHSPSRRMLAPVRQVVHAAGPVVRWLLRGRPAAPAQAKEPPVGRGLALIIDDNWPQPDRDGGSLEIVNLALVLQQLGFAVLLAAAKQHDGKQPARDRLEARGIPCLRPEQATSVASFIAERGPAIDLCVLCRVFCGGAFLEQVQLRCGKARLLFDTIDLNFVREERKARLLGDADLLAMSGQLRGREEHLMRSCDATIVVSEAEAKLLADTMPECLTIHLPLARDLHPPTMPFAGRRGIGFLGGFAHAPNADAVRSFLAQGWPLVRREMPDCEFTIVGADAPADLAAGTPGNVRVLGHMPDVGPWFDSLRASIAPLRFGAGAKGKVGSSLAAGVPCVASPIAAEGMSLTEDDGVLVAADPAAFAAAIARVCTDETLWQRLSAGAQAYAARQLSIAGWQPRLNATLRRIGL